MNKKLVKRVAVASLAALMTIPNLNVPINNVGTVYAGGAVESYERILKNYEQQLKNYESYGNTVMVEKTKERIAQTKQQLEAAKQKEANKAQKAAEQQAIQAEKERIANTIYPLTARYVKDFVPAVDDHLPHFYERPDLPGVIFVLEQDSFGHIRDLKPNLKLEIIDENYHRESHLFDHPERTFDNVCEVLSVRYTSPFNCIPVMNISSFEAPFIDLNGFWGQFCNHIGENREVKLARIMAMYYKSGWPDYYIGKHVNEITKENWDLRYGAYSAAYEDGIVTFPQKQTLEEIRSRSVVSFNTLEKVDTHIETNKAAGANWVVDQTIYSVAQEHGTDYTEEERKTLVIKPTPKSPYLNAKTEPIVDEKEWLEANGHMQMP